jgi:hypothetical protein
MREIWLTETCYFMVLYLQKTIIGLLHDTTQACTKYINFTRDRICVVISCDMGIIKCKIRW